MKLQESSICVHKCLSQIESDITGARGCDLGNYPIMGFQGNHTDSGLLCDTSVLESFYPKSGDSPFNLTARFIVFNPPPIWDFCNLTVSIREEY